MHRFFVAPAVLRSDRVTLGGAQARQIATVLRLRAGDEIVLVADGAEAVVALESVKPSAVSGAVRERGFAAAEPTVAVTLALPVLRGDHDDQVIEAVTQLGVARIVPFTSARSVARGVSEAKRSRWERIARESAETARRGRLPAIDRARTWNGLFDVLPRPVFVAWEGERRVRLRDALPQPTAALSIVIGPEGGLTEDEVATARERGATSVSLGARNLRSETAATAAVAIVVDVLDH
ncbi:MAG TPA: RsmE family RNA methyltransferase [Candidatus Limnocylindria bacterium]|jgi:16S rRNA (uracil1498-N3)-methyltransferase|nr:RsmE family RNA methyltransferase [Candidatus Limnocylindria bacterium]